MSFDISNFVNRGSVRWVVLAVFLFGTIFGATAIAAAELDGTESLFYDNTTEIANDTTEIKVTVNGTNYYDTYVNFYRIADDSNSTETLETEDVHLSAPEGETTNTTYAVETNNTAAYRVVVHNNGENAATASDIGNVTVTTINDGTGGTSGGYSPGNASIIGIIAVVALALVVSRKE
jgi:hypothetical protein